MAAPVTTADWLTVLAKRLDDRLPRISRLRAYASGHADLPEMSENTRESWEKFQRKAITNVAGLAVETVGSRIKPLGVTVKGSSDSPEAIAAHAIYRRSQLWTQIEDATRDRLTCDTGAFLAGLRADGKALITRERPEWFIADVDPADARTVRASLKAWRDESQAQDYAFVVVGGTAQLFSRPISRYRMSREFRVSGGWQPAAEADDRLGPGQLAFVSTRKAGENITHAGCGVGLFEPSIPTIDRLHKGKLERMVTAAMQAFRQRALKPVKDATGQVVSLPTHDSDGNEIDWGTVLSAAPGAIWDLPIPIDIWESETTDIRPLLEAEKQDARDFFAELQLPVSVFTPEGANQSATGADVATDGLFEIAKKELDDIQATVNDAMTRALQLEGLDVEDGDVEVLFENVERVSTQEKMAAAVQAKGAGMSKRYIMREIMGMNPDQMRQEESDYNAEVILGVLAAPAQTPTRQAATSGNA